MAMMEGSSTISLDGAAVGRRMPGAAEQGGRGGRGRAGRDRRKKSLAQAIQYAAVATRPRRILALLVMLWMLSMFDLSYTMLAHEIGGFVELNPIARQLIQPSWALVAFKLGTVALGTVILIALRRRIVAEIVCWMMCIIYTALAYTWMVYFTIIHPPMIG